MCYPPKQTKLIIIIIIIIIKPSSKNAEDHNFHGLIRGKNFIIGKSLFIKLLMTKTTGKTVNQMILQGRDVYMKDLRVPSVQLKLFNFIYLS